MKKYYVQWKEHHTMEIEVGDEVDKAEAIRLVRLSLSHRISATNFKALELETPKEDFSKVSCEPIDFAILDKPSQVSQVVLDRAKPISPEEAGE